MRSDRRLADGEGARGCQAREISGKVTLSANDEQPITVPVNLKVADWTLPDPQDYRTWVGIIQSPDTLAAEYGLPLWSEKHWGLIARSFRLMSDSGNRIVYVPLIAETNQGHAESMVRWVKKGENQYDYDFSVMDKYLDVAEKNLGPLKTAVSLRGKSDMIQQEQFSGRDYHKQYMEGKNLFQGKGPIVTARDPATGKTENVVLRRRLRRSSRSLWRPLFEKLRRAAWPVGTGKEEDAGKCHRRLAEQRRARVLRRSRRRFALGWWRRMASMARPTSATRASSTASTLRGRRA